MKLPAIAHAFLLSVLLAALGCTASVKDQAIESIRGAGGTFSYDGQGRITSVELSNDRATDEQLAAICMLPHVQSINCTNASQIKGSSLDLLANLKDLDTLHLAGTQLDDSGLARLGNLTSLKTLNLSGTRITDASMPAIDNLVNLQTLVLSDTAITDQGLVQLRDLRQLSTLVLRNTKTTPRGVKELQNMLRDVRIVD